MMRNLFDDSAPTGGAFERQFTWVLQQRQVSMISDIHIFTEFLNMRHKESNQPGIAIPMDLQLTQAG